MQTVAVDERTSTQKMFYRINEVSRITGIKPYVLRYWETEFPQLRPAKDSSDQRRYKTIDIALIQEIRRLLYEEKFTIAGARKYLQSKNLRAPAPLEDREIKAPALPTRQVQRVRKMIGSLKREVNNLCNFI